MQAANALNQEGMWVEGDIPLRDGDILVRCRTCKRRQSLAAATRTDKDESHTGYGCMDGCGLILTVRPKAEVSEWGYAVPNGDFTITGADEMQVFPQSRLGVIRMWIGPHNVDFKDWGGGDWTTHPDLHDDHPPAI